MVSHASAEFVVCGVVALVTGSVDWSDGRAEAVVDISSIETYKLHVHAHY